MHLDMHLGDLRSESIKYFSDINLIQFLRISPRGRGVGGGLLGSRNQCTNRIPTFREVKRAGGSAQLQHNATH